MARAYKEVLKKKMEDPEFKREWDELEPEFQLIREMLREREQQHLSQRQLAEMTGITQADICKIETGEANPTIRTLKRIADGLGMSLHISFVKKQR